MQLNCNHLYCCMYNIPWKCYKFPFSLNKIFHLLQYRVHPSMHNFGSISILHVLKIEMIIINSFVFKKLLNLPFWRIFLHIVAFTPGKCAKPPDSLQSVIDNVELSKGSAHFGSESDLHSQHLIDNPTIIDN